MQIKTTMRYHLTLLRIQFQFQFSHSVVPDPSRPHGLQHARLLCPSPTPGAYWNPCSSSHWCHRTIASSVIPFSSCLQSFPAWGSFQMSQFFASHGQSMGVSASASVHPRNAAAAKSLQSCPTLCDPIDGSPPGSPVPGILQARTLEWVAISFSKEYSGLIFFRMDWLDLLAVQGALKSLL